MLVGESALVAIRNQLRDSGHIQGRQPSEMKISGLSGKSSVVLCARRTIDHVCGVEIVLECIKCGEVGSVLRFKAGCLAYGQRPSLARQIVVLLREAPQW